MAHPAFRAGRTAVITGAASGIGLAAAKCAVSLEMAVVMIDLPGERLDSSTNELRRLGANVGTIGVDVSDIEAMKRAAEQAAAEMPPVTVLMNNAGMGQPSTAVDDRDAWERMLAVNFWGVLNGTQAFFPIVEAHGETSVIINTGSKQGITTPPGNPAYNVSKAAVKSYTEALAHELRNRKNCAVSAHLLIPGWVHTRMTAPSGEKNAATWTPEQTIDFMLNSLERGDFYILCPDNETPRALDERRIEWAAGDIVQNRPALSRWHPEWAETFDAFARR
ncbi:short-chain dehydrogenase [Rhizobium sp. J15]|uniref:SDR family NAD(P)-dependent oxidoreductase n=1 Tax=Rhizobium sp. J15 TaxID=2035450 RepID=UPI000BE893C6|nr:SDR family NAD(P)-dependent oxidoreductase [Rhizobium sp. J15]PDT12242.1 short-chain dehydrogenase [Rhizobium sp. J15]